MNIKSPDRRTFLKTSAATLAGASLLTNPARAQDGALGDRTIRVALVGCGGRGTGAAVQALSTEGPVELVAMADAFSDRLEGSLSQIRNARSERVKVADDAKFVGFDAYERAMERDVDLVILTTPPGFRPQHFEHAVRLGKHVFMEKPVAVDAPGVRRVLAAAEEAKAKQLKVGVGLQRHHDPKYVETVGRLQDGAIGRPVLLRCYWNSAGVWVRPRTPEQTEMTYQMRNWYYFNWLCGDHIVEQHIHNLDVCNWVMGGPPARAQGMGGRQVRDGVDHGEIFDHHMVEFTYPGGEKMISQCRHIGNTWSSVSEHVHGSDGTCNVGAGRIERPGGWKWRYDGEGVDPYQIEHDVLFRAVRAGTPHDEAELGATSTMTSIFGRMATYSGQEIGWDDALASDVDLSPSSYAWDADPPSLPDANGRYPIPLPGLTKVL